MKPARWLLTAAIAALMSWSIALPGQAAPQTITLSVTDQIIKGQDKAIVTADHSTYNERTILTDAAKISTQTLQLWTEGNTKLTEGELCFAGGAVYAELAGNVAWFFGPNCSLERPGLAIHSDNMAYHWDRQTAVFDGHVLCIYKGEHRAARTLAESDASPSARVLFYRLTYRTTFEKSATRLISISIDLSRPRRLFLTFSSLSMTMTPSKNASMGWESSVSASIAPV